MCVTFCLPIYSLETDKVITYIEKIEKRAFKQVYSDEDINKRLSRIEYFVFGKENPKLELSERVNKIYDAVEDKPTPTPTPEVKATPVSIATPNKLPETIEPSMAVLNLNNDSGVLGKVNILEKKIFGSTSENLEFIKRVEKLEENLLTGPERSEANQKSLLDRVVFLVKKTETAGINTGSQNTANQNVNKYVVDPTSGILLHEKTGQILRDKMGNPVSVNGANNFNQGFGGQNQNPLEQLLFGGQNQQNQNGLYPGLPSQPGLPSGIPPEVLMKMRKYNMWSEPGY